MRISRGKTSLGKEQSRQVCFMKQGKHKCSTSSAVKLHGGLPAPEGFGECGRNAKYDARITLLARDIVKVTHLRKHSK